MSRKETKTGEWPPCWMPVRTVAEWMREKADELLSTKSMRELATLPSDAVI
jgi:hypothetical protein